MVGVAAAFHVSLLGLSALLTTWLAVVGWRNRGRPGATPFTGMMAVASVWSAGYAAALLTPADQYGLRLFFEQLQWFGIVLAPVFVLLFFAEYTGFEELQRPAVVAGLCIVPVVTLVLVWTSQYHPLIWRDWSFRVVDGVNVATQQQGPWYRINLLYTYLLLGGSVSLLLYTVRRSEQSFSAASAVLIVGIGTPTVANLLSVLGYAIYEGLDMTPYAFSITGLAFAIAVFEHDLFERPPSILQLGRTSALGTLNDPVLITDRDGTIVTDNQVARDVLSVPSTPETDRGSGLVGVTIEALLPERPQPGGEPALITVDDRQFEVSASPVEDGRGRSVGTAYLLHDVTERERRLAELERRQDELERQRTELRELDAINQSIRSVLTSIVRAQSRPELLDGVTNRLATTPWYVHPTIRDESVPETTVEATDGGRMRATVPIDFASVGYGALVVESDREEAFDDHELTVLEELCASVGMALHAIETRETLLSDSLVALTYQVPAEGSPLARVSDAHDCTLTVEGTVPVEDSGLLCYVDVEDCDDLEAVADTFADADEVERVRQVPNRGTVEVRLRGPSALGVVTARGARLGEATAHDGRLTFVAETATGNAVRELTEALDDVVGPVSLQSKRERPPAAEDEGRTAPIEELTDRQREAVVAAHNAGYFDWPRESTAEEIADAMEIASSTFHSHLRKSLSKVVSAHVNRNGDAPDD
ncbi:histidine kinase N-terminal 7TM domain-containing protein [Haloarchaeobius iranensis]|uniref:HTH DNA binding domain-containing protein n=1 Tax=Haloarchaeobius iranensis TaxID=996166 RepID=A0A1G9YIB1_9EURY|nr:histidine kinase N-terminal 7TM domain-containing protein [Haloarchaeobius iranensis]SDN08193.1 HTH DNA binding domain-containing protein [Haloarchaeobius iranensis]